jgi:hypothetical protein
VTNRGELGCRSAEYSRQAKGERAYAVAPSTTTGVPENILTGLATIMIRTLPATLSTTIDSIGSDLINMYYPVSFNITGHSDS